MENFENTVDEPQVESGAASASAAPRDEFKPRKTFFFNDLMNRLGATAIDGLIFLGGMTVINFIASKFNGTLSIGGAVYEYEPHLVIIIKQIALALWFFFAVILRDTWGYSRSVGKRFCNLKIFTVRASRPRFSSLPWPVTFSAYSGTSSGRWMMLTINWSGILILLVSIWFRVHDSKCSDGFFALLKNPEPQAGRLPALQSLNPEL